MRKTATITITDDGRDKGKVFVLRELPASQAEKWAARAFLALSRSGVDIPENIANSGLAGIAVLGLKMLGGMTFADAEPLMDEMFRCIQIMPDPSRPEVIRPLIDRGSDGDDIEEISTRVRLRREVFQLHVDFSAADVRSSLTSEMSAQGSPNT